MGNLKSLQLAARNLKDVLKNIGKNKSVDPCPVCENELYYEKVSQKTSNWFTDMTTKRIFMELDESSETV